MTSPRLTLPLCSLLIFRFYSAAAIKISEPLTFSIAAKYILRRENPSVVDTSSVFAIEGVHFGKPTCCGFAICLLNLLSVNSSSDARGPLPSALVLETPC